VTYYYSSRKTGIVPVPVVVNRIDERMPNAVLAVLMAGQTNTNDAVIRAAIHQCRHAGKITKPVVFLYVGERSRVRHSHA